MPAVREPKPYWRDVPADVRAQIESLLSGRIRTASRVFGGYGPSATFRIFLEDGRTVFAKGAGKGSNEENYRVVPLEEAAYRDIQAIQSLGPTYFGAVKGEGWHLLLLEDLKGTKRVPPWTVELALQAVRDIALFHVAARSEADKLPVLGAQSLVSSWSTLRASQEERGYFFSLFGQDRQVAEEWLDQSIDTLDSAAQDMLRVDQPWGLIHTDIRSDNLRFKNDRLVLFDWPAIARGPLICDVIFFVPSLSGEGGPGVTLLLEEYTRVMRDSGVCFPEFAIPAAAAATAGYFACRAGRPPVPALPRLRNVQRLQLGPALRFACAALGLSEPPRFAEASSVPDSDDAILDAGRT